MGASWDFLSSVPPAAGSSWYYPSWGTAGQCTWYVYGRSGQTTGYFLPYGVNPSTSGYKYPSAKDWPTSGSLAAGNAVVCGYSGSYAPYKPGHVLFIERVFNDGSCYCSDTYFGYGKSYVYWDSMYVGKQLGDGFYVLGFTNNPNKPGGDPDPDPEPGPSPTPAVVPDTVHGPGGPIYLKKISVQFHGPTTDTADSDWYAPSIKLFIDGSEVAYKHGGRSDGTSGSDNNGFLDWAGWVLTDDFYIQVQWDKQFKYFYWNSAWFYGIEWYEYTADGPGTKHSRYFDGEKWTDWVPGLSSE